MWLLNLFLSSPGRLVSAGSDKRPTGLRHGRDLLDVHAVPLQHRPQLELAGLLVLSHNSFLCLESERIKLYSNTE